MEPLLTDAMVLERSKIWSTAMAEMTKKENFQELEFNEIQSYSEEENSDDDAPNVTIISDDDAPSVTIISDDDAPNRTNDITNNNKNPINKNCKALVKVDNFEGETSSDDFDECANKTFALIKEHQKKWERFGMMDVLETFDLDKISKVVVPWVEKNKLDKSLHSTSVDEHIVHIEEHHHRQIHLASDDDSLHSLDTANYIRSSRKKKSSSCTTTTIKKFSFVKGSRKHLQKKYGLDGFTSNKDLKKVFYEKFPENLENIVHSGLKDIIGLEKSYNSNLTPPSRPKAIDFEPRSLPARRRRSRHMKRRSDISKRSVSSSSSGADSPLRPLKPKYKRSSKSNSEDFNKLKTEQKTPLTTKKIHLKLPKPRLPVVESKTIKTQIDLTEFQTSDSESQMDRKKPLFLLPKQQEERHKANQGASSSNETGFLGASIINSTALSNTNQPPLSNPMKKCLITPIKNKPEQEHRIEQPKKKALKIKLPRVKRKEPAEEVTEVVEAKEIEQPKVPEDKSKILLYCPTHPEPHQNNLSGKRFYLTRDYFLEMVGKRNSRRFIKLNSRKFPFEFNCSSTIYFKLPEESGESASSDEDILYIFGREGKLIEETLEMGNVNTV